jgi:hypothetical protein
MISAVALGLFLGIVGALISEMVNPKVRRVWTPSRYLGDPIVELTRDAA